MSQSTTTTLSLPWVDAATCGFVNAQDMREAVSLALASGLNLIFSGPGGHGKSEFFNSVFDAITGASVYVKSFGQGTSNEELYGGLDFDALNRTEGATIQYNPELSFLAHQIAVFEELFDAPPRVLTSLKDTLTARELRNGHQRHAMRTRVIAAATNHSPLEIAEGGPEIAALIERFPIQLEVKWGSYDENAFANLFAAVTSDLFEEYEVPSWDDIAALQQQSEAAVISKAIQSFLAKLIVELRKDGVTISPRTAVLAMKLAKAAAALSGRNWVSIHDLVAVTYLPGAHTFKERIRELIAEFSVALGSEEALDKIESDLRSLQEARPNISGIAALREFIDMVSIVWNNLDQLRVTTHQHGRKSQLMLNLGSLLQEVEEEGKQHEAEAMVDQHRRELHELDAKAKRYDNVLRKNNLNQGQRRVMMTDVNDQVRMLQTTVYHSSLQALRDAVLSKFNVLIFNHGH